ncbi:primary-amine oxidase [Nocardioides sp.]|uniref:primary-amine oxidase n=1 Tax=Nocardioides sp. TaxID=35761 RepID=UPI003D0C19BC
MEERSVTRHPLAQLSEAEILAAREILVSSGLVVASTSVVHLGLEEPAKATLVAWRGEKVDRQILVHLLDTATGKGHKVICSLGKSAVTSVEEIDASTGQVAIPDSELEGVAAILADHEGWRSALHRRDLAHDELFLVPLSGGEFGIAGESGRRVVRVVGYVNRVDSIPWAHPVAGLCAYVDTIEGLVLDVIDSEILAVPEECASFSQPANGGPFRSDLKPIEITQPDGPSFTVDDGMVSWVNWRIRIGFNAREGLVLHQVSFFDGETDRSVLHRASVAEMVVPYADPSPTRYWQNYFDTGEYLFGRYTNSLTLGCDCVGEIHYLDAVVADEQGMPRRIANAICMHEEDDGVLWKHTDEQTGRVEVRRSRRLVISFFTTVGNYDYGFYWYFYLDGRIECEAKLTGIVFTTAPGEWTDGHASMVAPGLAAAYHQHLFCFRLDMSVDGQENLVEEIDVVRLPVSEQNPHGNAWTTSVTPLRSEKDGRRMADPLKGRVWHVASRWRKNRLGIPTAYELRPETAPPLLADPNSTVAGRAAFASAHLWVTRYDEQERFPAGDRVHRSVAGQGLPQYVKADRALDGEDVVLWHVFGPSHVPRTEDWPIMPVDRAKFALVPVNFFDRNPTLDIPPSTARGCATSNEPGACHPPHEGT